MTGQRTAWTRLRSALRPHASRGTLLPGLLCALLGFAVVVQVRRRGLSLRAHALTDKASIGS